MFLILNEMKRSLFCVLRLERTTAITRFASGFAIKEETVIEGSKLSPDPLDVNSAKPLSVKKQLYAWGLSENGALGLEKLSNKHHKNSGRFKHKPTRHFFGENNHVTHVECGFGFSVFAVKTRSNRYKVFGCGINSDSQVGYQESRPGHPLGLVLSPAPINLGIQDVNTDVISLAAGRAHLVVVTDKEGVFTLGSNCYGQCGRPIIQDEKYTGSSYIHRIKNLGGVKVVAATCGQDHSLFLNEEGRIFSCGWGSDGQTGLDTVENISVPTRVCGDISTECIIKLVGKCDTVLALSNKGEVFGWGNTEYFQLTDNHDNKTFINRPIYLNKLKGVGKIVDIAAGGSFCMALNEEGDVFIWGFGILGAGPNVDRSIIPIQVPKVIFGCNEFQPDNKVVSISCGLSHLAAVTNYCNLYTWGRNRHGCLGIGHIRDQYFPYKVCIGASVDHISCGVDHTMVLCNPYV